MPLSPQDFWILDINPRLLAQAGNYDYPRAGNSSRLSTPPAPPDRRPEVTARLAHLRALLDQDRQRDRQRLAIETLDSELQQMSAEPISSRLERRRRGLEAQLRGMEYPSFLPSDREPDAADSMPLNQRQELDQAFERSIERSRRRPAGRSERFQERDTQGRPTRTSSGNVDLRRPVDYSSSFDSLGDRPPRIGSPDILTQEYSGEAQVNLENRWRAKRRKLDSDDTRQTFRGFNYGHFGQVVPGQLKMELVSCDGGQYSENGDSSIPDHVLQNDSSVYCTKSDRCNMILTHLGETPFCLNKLVIKAPKTGFDAAIQEGMIFVSMERDDLLARTARYQIQYSPHRRRRRSPHGQIRLQPSHEYFNSVRPPLRSLNHDGRPPSGTRGHESYQELFRQLQERHRRNEDQLTHEQVRQIHDMEERTVPTVPRVPDFRVTTDFDDKSDNGSVGETAEDEEAHAAAEAEFDRILSMTDHMTSRLGDLTPTMSNSSSHGDGSSDDEFWDEDLGGGTGTGPLDPQPSINTHNTTTTSTDQELLLSRLRRMRSQRFTRSHRRLTPSRIQVATTLQSPSTTTSQDNTTNNNHNNPARTNGHTSSSSHHHQPPPQKEPLIPHASFFIRKDKNMVAIKFDPPV